MTVACPLPATAVGVPGVPGAATGAAGVTAVEAVDAVDVPPLLVAVDAKV